MIAMPRRQIDDRVTAWRDYCQRTHHDEAAAPGGGRAEWLDVRSACGAVGDGIADDADALQLGLDRLGSGPARVLHLPAGTYRISRTLQLAERSAVAVFGADSTSSTLVYDGSAGQPILRCRDVACVRIGHLAWDGRRHASAAVEHVWTRPRQGAWIEYVDVEFAGTLSQLAGGRIVPLPGRRALVPWY